MLILKQRALLEGRMRISWTKLHTTMTALLVSLQCMLKAVMRFSVKAIWGNVFATVKHLDMCIDTPVLNVLSVQTSGCDGQEHEVLHYFNKHRALCFQNAQLGLTSPSPVCVGWCYFRSFQ